MGPFCAFAPALTAISGRVNSRVAVNGFSTDGERLLVLTSDQVVYLLDPAAKQTSSDVASK